MARYRMTRTATVDAVEKDGKWEVEFYGKKVRMSPDDFNANFEKVKGPRANCPSCGGNGYVLKGYKNTNEPVQVKCDCWH